MTDPRCEETLAIAPELALGMATGEERARALEHIARCEACRERVAELSAVADDLLLLVPPQEPPAGFESRVLKGMGGRVGGRRWIAGVAAAVVGLLAAGGVWLATASDREIASQYREALAEANGRYFGVHPLTSGGDKIGNLFVYGGNTSWVFATLDEPLPSGTYRAELETVAGEEVDLGSVVMSSTVREWGRIVPFSLRDVSSLRIVDDEGSLVGIARFSED